MLRLLIFVMIAFSAYAKDLEVQNLITRANYNAGTLTIYFDLHNRSNEMIEIDRFDLAGLEHKDIILEQSYVDDKGISKVVRIDKLYIPALSIISLKPGAIHFLVKGIKNNSKPSEKAKLTLYPKDLAPINIDIF